jgi:hypothetical protein
MVEEDQMQKQAGNQQAQLDGEITTANDSEPLDDKLKRVTRELGAIKRNLDTQGGGGGGGDGGGAAVPVDENKLREIFRRADTDDSDALSQRELILRLSKDQELAQMLRLPQKLEGSEIDEFLEVFRGLDLDGNGSISSDEFVTHFKSYDGYHAFVAASRKAEAEASRKAEPRVRPAPAKLATPPQARSTSATSGSPAPPSGKVNKILGVVSRWKKMKERQLLVECFGDWCEKRDEEVRKRVIVGRLVGKAARSWQKTCFDAWVHWAEAAAAQQLAERGVAAAVIQRHYHWWQRRAALRELRHAAVAAKAQAEASAATSAAYNLQLRQELQQVRKSELDAQHATAEVTAELEAAREAAAFVKTELVSELQAARETGASEVDAARGAGAVELQAALAASAVELDAVHAAAKAAEQNRLEAIVRAVAQRIANAAVAGAFDKWVEWEQDAQHRRRVFSRVLGRLQHRLLTAAFAAWSKFAGWSLRAKVVVHRTLARWQHGQLVEMFSSWQNFAADVLASKREAADIAAQKAMREAHAAEVQELCDAQVAEVQAMRTAAAASEQQLAAQVAEAEVTHAAEVQELCDAKAAEVEAMRTAAAASEQQLAAQVAEAEVTHATEVQELCDAKAAEVEAMRTAAAASEQQLAAQVAEAEVSLHSAAETSSAAEESYEKMLAKLKADVDARSRELLDAKAGRVIDVERLSNEAKELTEALTLAKETASSKAQAAAEALVLEREATKENEAAAAASHAELEAKAAELAEALAAEKQRASANERAAAVKRTELEVELATAQARADAAVATRVDALVREAQGLSSEVAAARMEAEAATNRAWATNAAAFHTARMSTRDAKAQCAKYEELLGAARAAEESAQQARLVADNEQREWVERLSGKWAAAGSDENGPGVQELVFLYVNADGVVTGKVDDGDGIEDEDDCVITNGRVDVATKLVSFDQVYSDGAITKWTARYDLVTDRLVDGSWCGECKGTFAADRKAERGRSSLSPLARSPGPGETWRQSNFSGLGRASGSGVELVLTQEEALHISSLINIDLKAENDDNTRQMQELRSAVERSQAMERKVKLEQEKMAKKLQALELSSTDTALKAELKALREERIQAAQVASQQAEASAVAAASPTPDWLRELRDTRAEAATWKRQYDALERKKLELEEELAEMQPQLDVSAKLFEDALSEKAQGQKQVAQQHVAAAKIQRSFHASRHRQALRELRRHANTHTPEHHKTRLSMVVVSGKSETEASEVAESPGVVQLREELAEMREERDEKVLGWKRMQRRIVALEEELEQYASARQQDLEAMTATVVSTAVQNDAIVAELHQERYAHTLTRREVEVAYSPQNSPVAGVRNRTGSLPAPKPVRSRSDSLPAAMSTHKDSLSSDEEGQSAAKAPPTPPSAPKPPSLPVPGSDTEDYDTGTDTDDEIDADVEPEPARLAVEEAERERIAAEEAERERIAAEEAERNKRAAKREQKRERKSKPKAPPGKPTRQPEPFPVLSIVATLDKEYDDIPKGSPARQDFELDARTDLGDLMGVGAEKVTIRKVRAGSVILECEIRGFDNTQGSADEYVKQQLMSGFSIAGAQVTHVDARVIQQDSISIGGSEEPVAKVQDVELFECEFDCGFQGTEKDVAAHEQHCPKATPVAEIVPEPERELEPEPEPILELVAEPELEPEPEPILELVAEPEPEPEPLATAVDVVLPPGWTTDVSRSTGRTFYINAYTQETTYAVPTEAATKASTEPKELNETASFVAPSSEPTDEPEPTLPLVIEIANAEFEGKICWYELKFAGVNGESRSTRRRYSEFDDLRKDIEARDSRVLSIVEGRAPQEPSSGIQVSPQPFPGNKWRQSSKVIQKRKAGLAGWFNALLAYESLAPLLKKFLALANNDLRKTYGRLNSESELSVQVLRWMYVKDPKKGGKQYVVYEVSVTGPFPEGPATNIYHQRWSELYRFQDKFDLWSKRTAKIRNTKHMFKQQIPSKNTAATDDPKRLQSRTNELNRWATSLSDWANDVSSKGVIDLQTLLGDVIEPCFGEDRGGKSPTGRRAVLDPDDQDHAGWLSWVRKAKSEPYHVVLAKAGVEVGSMAGATSGEQPRWEGDEKGTLALYHGPRDQLAHVGFPISGRFFTDVSQVAHNDKGSPKAVRGLYKFSVQWYQMVGPDRDGASMLQLQQLTFTTSDGDSADEWIRKCRAVQRRHFADWNAEELGMWLQATELFASDEPILDCGAFANAVEKSVQNDDKKSLRRSLSVPLQKGRFEELWRALEQLLVDNLESDEVAGAVPAPAAPASDAQARGKADATKKLKFSTDKLQEFISVVGVDEETARECLAEAEWDVPRAVDQYYANPPPAPAPEAATGYYSLSENPLEETLDVPEAMPASRKAEAKAATGVLCEMGGWVDSLKSSHEANWGWVPEWQELRRLYKAHDPTKLRGLDQLVGKYGGADLLVEASKKYEPNGGQTWLLKEGFSAKDVCQIKMRFDDNGIEMSVKTLRGLDMDEIKRFAAREPPQPEDEDDDDDDEEEKEAEKSFEVAVQDITGKKHLLAVTGSTTVGELKRQLEAKNQVPARVQRLLYQQECLEEDTQVLREYGVQPGAVISLTLRDEGGEPKRAKSASKSKPIAPPGKPSRQPAETSREGKELSAPRNDDDDADADEWSDSSSGDGDEQLFVSSQH